MSCWRAGDSSQAGDIFRGQHGAATDSHVPLIRLLNVTSMRCQGGVSLVSAVGVYIRMSQLSGGKN